MKFKLWLIERTIRDFNDIINEVGDNSLPHLSLKPGISNTASMVSAILAGYAKEMKIQEPFGGIRNPSAVLQNKIRHELTNYDDIRDHLTQSVRLNKLSSCDALDIREKIVDKYHSLAEQIIYQLPKQLNLHGSRGSIIITQSDLFKSNEHYKIKELENINIEKTRNRCGKELDPKINRFSAPFSR